MTRAVSLLTGIVLLILIRQCGMNLPPIPEESSSTSSVPRGTVLTAPEQAEVRVKRVVDGDTLLLETGERVRLLGVDTPETVKPNVPVQYLGPEASAFTKNAVEGKVVTLVFDKERFDKYHRVLAFVYLDGRCLNEALIRNGLSKAQLQYPYRSDMKRLFQAAEKEARDAGRGLWNPTAPGPSSHSSSLQPAPVPESGGRPSAPRDSSIHLE